VKIVLQESKQRTKMVGYISVFLVKVIFDIICTHFSLYEPVL